MNSLEQEAYDRAHYEQIEAEHEQASYKRAINANMKPYELVGRLRSRAMKAEQNKNTPKKGKMPPCQ